MYMFSSIASYIPFIKTKIPHFCLLSVLIRQYQSPNLKGDNFAMHNSNFHYRQFRRKCLTLVVFLGFDKLCTVSISIKHLKFDFTAVNTIIYNKNSNFCY